MRKIKGADAIKTAGFAQFYFASWNSLNIICEQGTKVNTSVAGLWMPAYSNLCFACELYLRAILKSHQIQPDKINPHSLRDLFDQLEDRHKDKIKDMLILPKSKQDFDTSIEYLHNFYNKFRYIHDIDGKYPVGFLQDFSKSVKGYWEEREKILNSIKG